MIYRPIFVPVFTDNPFKKEQDKKKKREQKAKRQKEMKAFTIARKKRKSKRK